MSLRLRYRRWGGELRTRNPRNPPGVPDPEGRRNCRDAKVEIISKAAVGKELVVVKSSGEGEGEEETGRVTAVWVDVGDVKGVWGGLRGSESGVVRREDRR